MADMTNEEAVLVLTQHIYRTAGSVSVEESEKALTAIAALSAWEGGEAFRWLVGDEVYCSEAEAIEAIRQWGPSGAIAMPLFPHPAQPASQQGAIGEIVARPYGYGVEWLVSPAPAIGTKLYASQQGENPVRGKPELCGCGKPAEYMTSDGGRCCNKYDIKCQQAHPTGDRVRGLVEKWRALVAAHDGEFAFVDGVKLCLRELEAAIAGCQTEGRELPKYFVECSECEKAAYMRGIAVGENIASRDPVFAALDSVVPGWREHGSDTASAAATVITELSARATSNGSKPFRWDDDEGEAPSAWRPK
jgi:hypothetical protein